MTDLPVLDPVPPPDPTVSRAAARYVADPVHGLSVGEVAELLEMLGMQVRGGGPRKPGADVEHSA